MFVFLYTLFITLVSYNYRYELLYYILDQSYIIKQKYIDIVNNIYKYNGCFINNITKYDKFTSINYNYSDKSYILYINNTDITKYVSNNRLLRNIPYDIDYINRINNNRIHNSNISSDDDIIYASVIHNEDDIDVTDFCKMLSGPRGNFYNDLDFPIKLSSEIYKNDLLDYLKSNIIDNEIYKDELLNYKITYMTTLGDEFILE
jgi:hypothetical protein